MSNESHTNRFRHILAHSGISKNNHAFSGIFRNYSAMTNICSKLSTEILETTEDKPNKNIFRCN